MGGPIDGILLLKVCYLWILKGLSSFKGPYLSQVVYVLVVWYKGRFGFTVRLLLSVISGVNALTMTGPGVGNIIVKKLTGISAFYHFDLI